MSALHHLLRRCSGALALVLAFAVLMGSLCPRGWFVCVHEEVVALVDARHAQDAGGCADHVEDCCPADADGCLDLALSLVLDDQAAAFQSLAALPAGQVLAVLPDLRHAASSAWMPAHDPVGGPPPSPFVSHIRLLV